MLVICAMGAVMIDKYLLEDLSLRSDEKGELARWVIQLQADVDTERRKSASLERVIYDRDTRIIELEAIKSDASQVLKEIGNELGCNPDNESIMMAIDELKSTQMAGPLALIIKRAEEMERILEGVTPEMIAGGWTAKGISDYAKSLEAKLATPVRLPDDLEPNTEPCVICGVVSSHPEGWHYCNRKNAEGDA